MLIPALIAGARAGRRRHIARVLRIAARRAARRFRLARERFVEARRQRREIEFLLHADDRMLADIGLTRADVYFAFGEGRKAEAWNAAHERDRTRAAATSGIETLPEVKSPSLAPALPRQTIPHENFR